MFQDFENAAVSYGLSEMQMFVHTKNPMKVNTEKFIKTKISGMKILELGNFPQIFEKKNLSSQDVHNFTIFKLKNIYSSSK